MLWLKSTCLGATVLFLMLMMPLDTAQPITVNQKNDLPPSWGPILSASCNASFEWYGWGNTTILVPVFSYKIVGIGDHNIEYTMTYNLSHHDGSWRNDSITLRDGLYFTLKPFVALAMLMGGISPWKLVAQNRFTFPQDELKSGFWSISMIIDDKKFIEDTYVLRG